MIALDTNILVYAHRADSEWHEPAVRVLTGLAEDVTPWAIPWPCVHEFLAIATHPRIYDPPSPAHKALEQVASWLESPSVVLLAESTDYWPTLRKLLEGARVIGPQVHDARIAALCVTHGVHTLWSADRDFSRFGGFKVINPLLPAGA